MADGYVDQYCLSPRMSVTYQSKRYLKLTDVDAATMLFTLILYYLHDSQNHRVSTSRCKSSHIHRQMPTHMAEIRCDWLTNQNTDCCFVVIGLSTRQSHSPLQQLKIDPVRQLRSAILVGI